MSKQTIDAIMAENGKDIQATRALFSDYEALKEELNTAQMTIAHLQQDSEKLLQEKMAEMEDLHQKEMLQKEYDFFLRQEVEKRGGMSHVAVEAMLDTQSLRQAEDPQKATREALSKLQQENPWLFAAQTPPPLAKGTGVQMPQTNQPATLAGALRERFEKTVS